MQEGGYKIRNQEAIHFITFAVTVPIAIGRVVVFTRKDYRDIVLDSLKFCQAEKGLLLHCWCIMSNHLHLIISAKNKDLSDVSRDFKNLLANKSLEPFKITSMKAGRITCLPVGRDVKNFQRTGRKQ